MRKKIQVKFNPDCMEIREVKACVSTLRGLLQDLENFTDEEGNVDYEEIGLRVLQIADAYEVV